MLDVRKLLWGRSTSWWRRTTVAIASLVSAVLAAALMLSSEVAQASYPGANGVIAWESFVFEYGDAYGCGGCASDRVRTASSTIASCDFSSAAQSCLFGEPSYSPDGRRMVLARLVPTDVSADSGDEGAPVVVGGGGERMLARQTVDDRDPAFLHSGNALVFDGRTSPGGQVNLFTLGTSGTGLRQLTRSGGSQPAPCANGTIAFVKHHDIYLLSANRRSQRRVTFRGGDDPSCAPDSSRIAFVRNGDLYTIASDGTRLHRLTFKATSHFPSSRAYSPTYSPDGREIGFLAAYDAPQQNGSQVALELVNLRGHHVRPNRVIADTAFSNGSYVASNSAGIAWQPRPNAAAAVLERRWGNPTRRQHNRVARDLRTT